MSWTENQRETHHPASDHQRNRENRSPADAQALERELKASVDGEVRFDMTSRALYATDGSNYRFIPIGVVIPKSIDAVIRTVELCNNHDVPLFNRGAGTALAGQTCNVAVCIDFSKYLNKIIRIDPEARTARVQPGVILDDLRNAAEKFGLTFGPDPATHTHCTLGGMLGNNSCGVHSIMAGRTVDNVHELEILTYDGIRLRVGPTSEAELETIITGGGRRGEIYAGMKKIRDERQDQIRSRYPDIPRRVSGYNLDELLPEKGFHVARALVGSESTCVTILETTLRLVPSPPVRLLLVLGYPDIYSAGDHIPQIMEFGPIGLEGIDDTLISQMKSTGIHPRDIQLLPEGGGWLLAEFGGETKTETEEKVRSVMDALAEENQPPSMKLFDNREEEEKVWEIRESGLGATAHVPGEPLTWPGWEDAAVDPARMGGYLRDFHSLMKEFNYNAALYGHFGQGCIHCRINFDLFTRDGIDKYLRFIDRASDLVLRYNGSFSGEHGDGQSRAALLGKMFGPELLEAFRDFKSLWDPQWRMNPGKVIDPYAPDKHLRLGEEYHPWQPETRYRFPADSGSFSKSTLRCVGVGKCRRPARNAFMCPSFLVTRDEQHTTRGRAHILFEMLRRDFIRDGWQSKDVFATLDLCLGCKGCKKECPVDVDIATYKSEFLAHYYRGAIRPRHHYLFGKLGILAAAGSKIPHLANFLAGAPFFNILARKIAGVHWNRPLPSFADQTFLQWFAGRPDIPSGSEDVVLYPDSFNNFFSPQVLQATVRLLERWGFTVIVPRKHPDIRPLLHYGMLERAGQEMQVAVQTLAPYVAQGIPVILAEPTTAAVFRDELPGMFPDDKDAQRITEHTRLLSEFIEERGLPLPEMKGSAVFHGHCHQKAVLDVNAARKTLRRIGLTYCEPQAGCCGMAGSFGFEKEHYAVSQQVAELNLLPAIRASGLDSWIVADGFSCRNQIKDGTARKALHLAELIEEGFRLNDEGLYQMEREKTGAVPDPHSPVVVITGASAGLGRSITQAFAREGAKLCLVARNRERLEETRREAIHLGGQAIIHAGDVADPDVLEQAAQETEKAFGPIDYWVNNAMVTIFSEFSEIEPEEFKRVTEVTYLGYVYGTMAALKRMIPRDSGTIIQVGSALSKRSIPLQSAYCGAKHAINGFTESIRTELIHRQSNVHVTIVQMPALNTPQFTWNRSRMPRKPQPVPPIFQPEVGADAVLYASREKKKQIYVGFSTLQAVYGERFSPEILDHLLASKGYQSQMTEEPEDPDRADNLFQAVEGLQSAHGPFDSQARDFSLEMSISKHKKKVGLGIIALGLGISAGLYLSQRIRKRR